MELFVKILAGAIPGAILLFSIFVFFCCRCRRRRRNQQQFISNGQLPDSLPKPSDDTLHAAIARLHLSHKSSSKTSLRFHQLHQHHYHQQQDNQHLLPFSWENHPRLISEAAENGWSRFVFANRTPVPRSSPLWGLCSVCDGGGGRPQDVGDISWEAPSGSSEFMQTVRINPNGSKRSFGTNTNTIVNSVNSPLRIVDESVSCCIRMSLPLPGPPLIGTSFPQEAYFEITILYLLQPMNRASRVGKRAKDGTVGNTEEDDRVKLIEESSNGVQSDAMVHAVGDSDDVSEGKKTNTPLPEAKHKDILISLGLTKGGSPLTKLMPGTYPSSIGFHSNGCVYLDGLKLVSESEKTEWAVVNKVIGCGFNPSKKKVFFTIDSELVHVIRCNSDVYKSPLYPILSSNSDVMVLVNLGQQAFKYAPANAHRTANPCSVRSSPSCNGASVISYEDSRELFSMGRIDSDWHDGDKKGKSAGNTNSKNSCRSSRKSSGNWEDASSLAVDIDGESDLFEISIHN